MVKTNTQGRTSYRGGRCENCGRALFVSSNPPGVELHPFCRVCDSPKKVPQLQIGRGVLPKLPVLPKLKPQMQFGTVQRASDLPVKATEGQLYICTDDGNIYAFVRQSWMQAGTTKELETLRTQVKETVAKNYDKGNDRKAAIEATRRKKATRE